VDHDRAALKRGLCASIGKMGVGYAMKTNMRIEIGGDGKRPPYNVVAKINAKFGEVIPPSTTGSSQRLTARSILSL
jgi:hypothetical protein